MIYLHQMLISVCCKVFGPTFWVTRVVRDGVNPYDVIAFAIMVTAVVCFIGGPVLAIYTDQPEWLLLTLISFPFLWA